MHDQRDLLGGPSRIEQTLRLILAIVAILLILAACFAAPLYVASWVHPAAGALVAFLLMAAWVYIGPPPMPGFVNGIVAIQGLFALFAAFVICVIETLKLLWI